MVTDSIPESAEARACDKIRRVTIADMLGETIRRVNLDESVTALMQH